MPCSDQHFIPILDELDQRAREAEAREALGKRRGGPRPGSGPPRGNLNALKHGRYSRRHKKLLESLLEVPEARQALIDMANRNRERVSKAEIEAAYLLMRWLANNNPQGLTAAMDEASANIQSEACPERAGHTGGGREWNDQARNDQLNKALADMETAFVAKISKNATKKRTPKPKKQPKGTLNDRSSL